MYRGYQDRQPQNSCSRNKIVRTCSAQDRISIAGIECFATQPYSPVNPKHHKEDAFREMLWKGVSLFNRGSYFDAHEIWEDLWRGMKGDSKRTMQGIIQVAVGAHHLQRKNLHGARSVFRHALQKLSADPVDFYSLDLTHLVKELQLVFEKLRGKSIPPATAFHFAVKIKERKRGKGK